MKQTAGFWKRALLLCMGMISFAGCATAPFPNPSGFLGERGAMYPGALKGIFIIDDDSPGNVGDYRTFMVDPVIIYLNPSAKAYALPKEALAVAAESFRQELIRALQEKYAVVEQPGPGVLRIKVAFADSLARGSADEIARNAVFEMDLIDASTGSRVVGLIAEIQGRSLRNFCQELAARIAMLQRQTRAYVVE